MTASRESNYNVIVIGAGAAGLAVAEGTNELGGRVALVERRQLGGDCLNYGSVPSKALIASAHTAHLMRHANHFGFDARDPAYAFDAIFDRMRDRRARLEPRRSQERFEAMGVDVFHADARLASPHEVDLDNGTRLKAANIVIATGTRPHLPAIDGLDDVPYYTNESIFDELHDRPEHLVIVGGGPIGCELGQAFRRLGSKVTIIEAGDRPLIKEDPDVSDLVRERLSSEGVTFHCHTQVKAARQAAGNMLMLTLADASGDGAGRMWTVEADTLLIAAGREPNLASLGLEDVSIRTHAGGVAVNSYLQTTEPSVFAVGDVTGHPAHTHSAEAQARVAVRNILTPWLMKKFNPATIPRVTYTDPEVATIGLNETTARQRGMAYDLYTQPIDELDRAILNRQDVGFARVLTAKGKDQILGAMVVAPHAGELSHAFALAIHHDIGLRALAGTAHAYPTLGEIAGKLGVAYNRTRLTARTRKVLAWLYRRARRRVPE